MRGVEGAREAGVEGVAQVRREFLILELLEEHVGDERVGVQVQAAAQAARQRSQTQESVLHDDHIRVLDHQLAQRLQ